MKALRFRGSGVFELASGSAAVGSRPQVVRNDESHHRETNRGREEEHREDPGKPQKAARVRAGYQRGGRHA